MLQRAWSAEDFFKMYFSRLTAVNEMSNPNKENYKRFRDFFLLEMCILVFNFVLFLHLLAHFYNTSFKKKIK